MIARTVRNITWLIVAAAVVLAGSRPAHGQGMYIGSTARAVVSGQVLYPNGAVAQGVTVNLTDTGGGYQTIRETVTTDRDGRFVTRPVPNTTGYMLAVYTPQSARADGTSVHYSTTLRFTLPQSVRGMFSVGRLQLRQNVAANEDDACFLGWMRAYNEGRLADFERTAMERGCAAAAAATARPRPQMPANASPWLSDTRTNVRAPVPSNVPPWVLSSRSGVAGRPAERSGTGQWRGASYFEPVGGRWAERGRSYTDGRLRYYYGSGAGLPAAPYWYAFDGRAWFIYASGRWQPFSPTPRY